MSMVLDDTQANKQDLKEWVRQWQLQNTKTKFKKL